jgi:hypothetical protein
VISGLDTEIWGRGHAYSVCLGTRDRIRIIDSILYYYGYMDYILTLVFV